MVKHAMMTEHPNRIGRDLGGRAFHAASSAMEASMLWMSCRRSRESLSRYTRLLSTAAAYWEKVVSLLASPASFASFVKLAAHAA